MSVPQAEATTESAATGRSCARRSGRRPRGAPARGARRAGGALATYGDRVYRLAIRITGNEQDAEEVVQDALWTAARKIDTFKGESAFGSWVYRITANAAYQKLRSRHGQRNEISWDALTPGASTSSASTPSRSATGRGKAEEPALQTELRNLLTTAIDDLPGDYRTAFLHARRGGALEPGDRRDAAHQPARGEVARAPLAAVPPPAAGRLHAGGLRAS